MLLKTISDFYHIVDKQLPNLIGLVPTMGALHEGHLFLIEQAKKDCDCVVVSIFVNPTQFNDPNDLSKYPRTLDQDLESIRNIDSNILVYAPSVDEIYPDGSNAEHFDFGTLSKFMEGQFRQGHFDGVGTVLKRLFNLVKPHKAYFGEKDYQQLAVVKKLVEITEQQVEVIGCETYRETNGLAKSSRNKLLSPEEKNQADILITCLKLAKSNFNTKPISEIKKMVKSAFNSSEFFTLEYFEIASDGDLVPTETLEGNKKYRAFIAAYCNGVRLIDNIALN